MKKGQVEALGILVAIILILLVATFALGIILQKKTTTNTERTQYLANNIVGVWLSTTLCESYDVREAIVACYLEQDACGTDACELIETVQQNIIQTIDSKIGYTLNVIDEEQEKRIVPEKNRGDCQETVSAQEQYVDDNIVVRFSLCE